MVEITKTEEDYLKQVQPLVPEVKHYTLTYFNFKTEIIAERKCVFCGRTIRMHLRPDGTIYLTSPLYHVNWMHPHSATNRYNKEGWRVTPEIYEIQQRLMRPKPS